MLSLRRRAIVGGALSGALSLVVGFFLLSHFVNSLASTRFDAALQDRQIQVLVALSNSDGQLLPLADAISDPAYLRPYSGRYWQVVGSTGITLTSRSLLDQLLTVPPILSDQPMPQDMQGPNGDPIRALHQQITLDDGSKWRVTVAESLTSLQTEVNAVRLSLLQAFALLGLLGIATAILQITAVLAPLGKLRKDVAKRWDDGAAMDPEEYPQEVAPLVSDINALLDRNREVVARARRQAADLAHALKTPCAIMRNELESLASDKMEIADAREALDRIDAQLGRSLARIRATNSAASAQPQTDLNHSISRFARLFKTMAENQEKKFVVTAGRDLKIRMDQQDIEEVLGNLLDNGLKWCRSQLHLTAHRDGGWVRISIEDDGPGIREDAQREALRAGGRLDTSTAGTGLGLAIAVDLLKAYGGNLELGHSQKLGGLSVKIAVPDRIVSPDAKIG